jgi:hypothetical protein
MRSTLLFSTVGSCALAIALPGCFGGTGSVEGPTTLGDAHHTVWQIDDGLCGHGLFGSDCDLTQVVAIGATPRVVVRSHDGTSLARATLVGASGVAVTGFATSTDDHGVTTLSADVGLSAAGTADVIVRAMDGTEIDRAHVVFADAAALACGELSSHVVRDVGFSGLDSTATVDVVAIPMDGGMGEASGSTTLACRATDASGRAILTVRGIRWTVVAGAVGTIDVHSDDLFGSQPAFGATARVTTVGTGHATIHAEIGVASDDVDVTFH